MNVSYTWLKDYLGENAPSVEEIDRLLTFHAFEIEGMERTEDDDVVIDVDVLPNRSSDCLCHRGIAREISTITGTPLSHDPLATPPELPSTDAISVEIEDSQACPRFTAMLVENVEVRESPNWLKKRLAAIGARPINNIVDATNYVMYATGQPLHAYDADRFPQEGGSWQFGVRRAREGEQVSLLAEGGKDEDRIVECRGGELLIVDRSSDTPIGLAGVKGGRFAGVHEGTKRVIIEAAHFHPTLTRQTARRLGIIIDASKRFENEPSRELPPYAQAEIAKLIADIAGGTAKGMVDVYPEKRTEPTVTVRTDRVNALLGLSLEKSEMIDIVERLGATVAETEDGFTAIGPFERTDLLIEEDYIEEIGRIHGLQHIGSVVPEAVTLMEINAAYYYADKIRRVLISEGFSEVITSSFRKKDEIQLLNALASDKSCVRSNLHDNLEEVLAKNTPYIDLLGLDRIRVFEIGTVFDKGEQGIGEHTALAIGVRSKASGYTKKDDEPLLEAIAALKNTFGTDLPFVVREGVAEMNLSTFILTLPAPAAYEPLPSREPVQYQAVSPYPSITRDVALWVDGDVEADVVEKTINTAAGELRVRTTLFDEFQKDGRTSYAFRLVFQSPHRTLTDSEVNKIMNEVYKAVAKKGWEVR